MLYLQSKACDTADYFYNAIVCITENNERGAIGFIINRRHSRSLNELQEFAYLPYFLLYEGGPVDTEHLFFLHRRPDMIDGGKLVSAGTYFGGDFKQATAAIARGILHQDDIRIFIGYCGWDAGELKEEIRKGDWEVTETSEFNRY